MNTEQIDRHLARAVSESIQHTTPPCRHRRKAPRPRKHSVLLDVVGFAAVAALVLGYLAAAVN